MNNNDVVDLSIAERRRWEVLASVVIQVDTVEELAAIERWLEHGIKEPPQLKAVK